VDNLDGLSEHPYDEHVADEEANADGTVDERGILITEAGKARARARRLDAEAKVSAEDWEALRARYGLRRRSA